MVPMRKTTNVADRELPKRVEEGHRQLENSKNNHQKMAYNFSANQFEDGYRAKRLRNWEVPKWFPSHPRTPLTTTQFIADSRGHLLPGVPKANPWGSYKGTWDLPNKITKNFVEEANAPPHKLQSLWGKRPAPPNIKQQVAQSDPERLPALKSTTEEHFKKRNKSSSALDLQAETHSKLEPLQPLPGQQSTPNIASGTLDEDIKQILEENETKEEKSKSPVLCRAIENLQQTEAEEEQKEAEIEEPSMVADEKKYGGPLINDYSAFQVAKRFHDENLKHQPLPDVVDDPVFKALASNKDPFPGRVLDVHPNAAAIGWKGSGAPGPTKCSKVKVYRPKTAAVQLKSKTKLDSRPKTCEPQKEKRFLPIDLAICWDLAPQEKPRRTPHIDGSEGGQAPSVFAVVRTTEHDMSVTGSPQALASHVADTAEENNVGTLPPKIGEQLEHPTKRVTNKSAIMAHVKPTEESPAPSFHSLSPKSAVVARQNPKTAWSNHDTSKELSQRLQELEESTKNSRKNSNDKILSRPLSRQKLHRSTPNLVTTGSQTKKQCEGSNCGTDSTVEKRSKESKEEYKMAFKAGMPNKAHTPPPQSTKPLKMPKMRPPYAKKNYAISTLIPPFSLWPDHHGQEYPEHWRLASVYQHSYKPVDYRRKPLLASIYQ